jgi:hypothetical protein
MIYQIDLSYLFLFHLLPISLFLCVLLFSSLIELFFLFITKKKKSSWKVDFILPKINLSDISSKVVNLCFSILVMMLLSTYLTTFLIHVFGSFLSKETISFLLSFFEVTTGLVSLLNNYPATRLLCSLLTGLGGGCILLQAYQFLHNGSFFVKRFIPSKILYAILLTLLIEVF